MKNPSLLKSIVLTLPFAALLALPAPARALDLGLRLEPGVALPLSEPQSQRFDFGATMAMKGYLGLGRYFDAQVGFTFLRLNTSGAVAGAEPGEAWSDSFGLRFKRPHDAAPGRGWFYAASPWIDADALYVRTGGLDRFGFTAGLGVSFPVDLRRNFWVGPFARYMQIVQPDRAGFDNRDASLLLAGFSFEIGSSPMHRHKRAGDRPMAGNCPLAAGAKCPPGETLSDRDHDGLLDAVDTCPDFAGTVENHGCRVYKRVVVKTDRLELTEKIMFASDQAVIEEVSFPLLDEVVLALQDNKGFRVRIEGHADSSGPDARNQTLSEQRAAAVLAYLGSHGVPKERLTSKGFSSSEPTVSNDTAAGRETNRRVEFVIYFNIVDRSVQ
jgi:outer membrane protein OmpA-like peptidoglycan-associated protein